MAESLSLDREPCIVLSVVPYNDGRRVVRVLGETLGAVALWVTEGRGKNRQVGKWHPGAMLELRGSCEEADVLLALATQAVECGLLDLADHAANRCAMATELAAVYGSSTRPAWTLATCISRACSSRSRLHMAHALVDRAQNTLRQQVPDDSWQPARPCGSQRPSTDQARSW